MRWSGLWLLLRERRVVLRYRRRWWWPVVPPYDGRLSLDVVLADLLDEGAAASEDLVSALELEQDAVGGLARDDASGAVLRGRTKGVEC